MGLDRDGGVHGNQRRDRNLPITGNVGRPFHRGLYIGASENPESGKAVAVANDGG